MDFTDLPADLGARLATDCEPGIERLWRAYFERITNPERRNPRLQRKLMPARYWGLLIERPGGVSRQEKKEGM